MTTTGNSSPLALCSVISQTRASARALLLVDVRQQRQPIDEAAERRAPARALSYSRAADTSSVRFSMRPSASSLRSSRSACR